MPDIRKLVRYYTARLPTGWTMSYKAAEQTTDAGIEICHGDKSTASIQFAGPRTFIVHAHIYENGEFDAIQPVATKRTLIAAMDELIKQTESVQ